MHKFIVIFLVFFSLHAASFALADDSIGQCIRDPNALALQKEWKTYFELKQKKAKINLKIIRSTLYLSGDSLKLIESVSEAENLIQIIDQLESLYLKKAFVDTRFNDLVASPDFINRLENKSVDDEIKSSQLEFKGDPKIYQILDQIRDEIKKSETKQAIEFFRSTNLGILEAKYRQSAKKGLKLIRKYANQEQVRSWNTQAPLLKDVPLPSPQIGPFAIRYRATVSNLISNHIMTRSVSLDEAKLVYPKISQVEVEKINHAEPPTEKNAFDESIAKQSLNEETAAIDGVARTLWGEASSCEMQNLSQFEAIGRIITDRALAVCRARDEAKNLEQKNEEVREKNWKTFLNNWIGIKRPAPGMKNKATLKLKGLSDFGRSENVNIPCAAQVISKKGQFSVWNSFTTRKFHAGNKIHKNFPDAVYSIQGPQAENDDRALVRILCPQFETDRQKELWAKARSIASDIVKDPIGVTKRLRWPIQQSIYFYTHDAELPFADEVQANFIKVDNKKKVIRKPGAGPCNRFRLFSPRAKSLY